MHFWALLSCAEDCKFSQETQDVAENSRKLRISLPGKSRPRTNTSFRRDFGRSFRAPFKPRSTFAKQEQEDFSGVGVCNVKGWGQKIVPFLETQGKETVFGGISLEFHQDSWRLTVFEKFAKLG